jgi:asparagine synthase (glutamine-hydrolysing)
MTATLVHRGPDADNLWVDQTAGVAFGHRRLSVLDLTAAGAQPMQSDCGQLTITFNGEIYNHLDIRAELEIAGAAPNWKGHSDTETLLYAVRFWGIDEALRRFNGMFAFAIWDACDRTLTLCRDRFGEKPLFYGWIGSDLVFASELKAFFAHAGWSPSVDKGALTAFMRYSYVPAPWTIWKGIRKLNPGSLITFSPTTRSGELPAPQMYWSMRQCVIARQGERPDSGADLVLELEQLLSQAVKRQLLSDVPVGAFLSGGIDSSIIVALLQKQSPRRIKTFSVGFAETAFNEATHAGRIASYLGTDHTELTVSSTDACGVIPRLAQIYDEPFADSSQIPTHLVATLARRDVTVALSGDAGDELFGGYNRHVWGARLHARFDLMPSALRPLLVAAIKSVAPEPANTLGHVVGKALPARYRTVRVGDLMAKVGRIVGARTPEEMYRLLCSVDDDPTGVIREGREQRSWFADQMDEIAEPIDALDRMTLADALSYLSDDVLQKVDRAAMAVSLETRVPFLDRDVVEFSCRVPPDMKVRAGRGKWLVRQVLDRHVPRELADRPKTGFSIPLDVWLRGPLREWASDLLAPSNLERCGWFNSKRVADVWSEHLNGYQNHGSWLWNVLMAQSWAGAWSR